jgi:hypothetical protein
MTYEYSELLISLVSMMCLILHLYHEHYLCSRFRSTKLALALISPSHSVDDVSLSYLFLFNS